MKIAILIPCFNEALTIGKVVQDVKKEFTNADVYVYDNNSTDKTAEIARANGAIVAQETRQGKGNVVRSMFKDIEADVYVLIDGDDACPVECIHELIKPVVSNSADMVIGERMTNGTYSKENKRAFHSFGNNLVKNLINFFFKSKLTDIMAGYRSFSRYYVKTFPVLTMGFEIETEMTIFALHNNYKVVEVPIVFRNRPTGSVSKLNTFRDGLRVLKVIFFFIKDLRPLLFFGISSFLMGIIGIIVGIPPIIEFLNGGYVYRVPSAILAAALEIIAFLLFAVGLILDSSVTYHRALHEQNSILFKVIDQKEKASPEKVPQNIEK
jgi:glycosyltransferase involved in cell wall biosynthesis